MKKFKWLFVDFFVLSVIFVLSILIVVLGRWTWKWATFFFIATYIFNFVFITFSLINDDHSTEKMSWIFFMICFPYVGLVFYMLFRIRRDVGVNWEKFEQEFQEFKIENYKNKNIKEFVGSWQEKLIRKNFHNTELKIFKHGYDAYEHLLNDIKNAKKYIHIEMYIIKESEIYEKLKRLLFEKVKEGVEVKIIFDKFGSWKVPIDEFKYLKFMGIDLCFYNVPIYPYVRHTDNKRLHQKFFIIDGEVIHFGGLNITDEYWSFSKKYGYWADSNFSAKGKIINEYQSYFLFDWYKITNQKLNKNNYLYQEKSKVKANCKILTFNETPLRKDKILEQSLVFWINNSTTEIKLVTPYFIPTFNIYTALKNALKRGVKIEMYIPGKPDKKFTYKASIFYSNSLSRYGMKVYALNNTFLHAKFATFDNNYAYIGTNNLDMRSFYSNQEGINLLYGDAVIKQLNNITDFYKELSIERKYKKYNKIRKIYSKFIFKLFSPLM